MSAQLIDTESGYHLWSEIYETDMDGVFATQDAYGKSIELFKQALAIDPTYAPAHRSLARVARNYDHDMPAAARHFEQAFATEPANIDSITDTAYMAKALGRLELAIALTDMRPRSTRYPLPRMQRWGSTIFLPGAWTRPSSPYARR